MADLQIKEAIPVIKEIMQRKNIDVLIKNELKFALKKLETGEDESSEFTKPYAEQRGPWKAHYKSI